MSIVMNNSRKGIYKLRTPQSGFTMVELLVAMGLSAGLLFGVLQIFDANRQSSHMQAAFSEVQEGGRIAMEILTRDIRMANSWGCNKDAATVQKHILGGAAGWGSEGIKAADNVGSILEGAIPVKPGSDMITVMGAHGVALVREPYMLNSADNITVNTGATIPVGTNLVLSNCDGTDIFENTNASTGGDGLISHATPLTQLYGADARLGVPFTHLYFIGQNPDGAWSLYRRVSDEDPEELVRNVTDLQIVYGIGNVTPAPSADPVTPVVNQFVAQPTVVQLSEVISARLQIVLESENNLRSGAPLQKTFLATANIRNSSLKVVPLNPPSF